MKKVLIFVLLFVMVLSGASAAWREWKRTAVRFATDNSARRGGQRCALRRPVPATDEKQPQVRRITLLLR